MSKNLTVETDMHLITGNPVKDDADNDVRKITEKDSETGEETTYHTDTRTNLLTGNPVNDDAGNPIIDIKPDK